MPIQINQRFPRCQLCGKLIPLRAEPRRITQADGKVVSFCSEECRQDYQRRLEAGSRAQSAVTMR
jgi:ribosomal protein L24E